jgi:hypothetical protein
MNTEDDEIRSWIILVVRIGGPKVSEGGNMSVRGAKYPK